MVGGEERLACSASSRALLHLIGFDEPFGLSVIEAMACGTPVIAYRRGSMPELIEHGVTGFLVDTFEEAVEAIGRLGEIDRAACRRAVEERFTVERMADDYLALYRRILAGEIAPMRDVIEVFLEIILAIIGAVFFGTLIVGGCAAGARLPGVRQLLELARLAPPPRGAVARPRLNRRAGLAS